MRGQGTRPGRFERLLFDDQDGEGARFHFATALSGSWRRKLCGREKDFVSFQVQAHGAGGALGRDVFDDGELVGRIFVNDRQMAVTTGSESVVRGRVEGGRIGAIADFGSGHDSTSVGVSNGHDFFIADREQAAVFEVHGKAGRRLARR